MEHENLYLTPFQRKLLLKKLYDDALSHLSRQRIKIMILADRGIPQSEICLEVGCCASTARHWIHMARSGMAHLWEDSPRGRPKIVTDAYLERLSELLTHSPRDYKYPFSRWTADWLRKHLAQEFSIEVSLRHFKRLLKQVKESKDSNTASDGLSQSEMAHLRTQKTTNLDPRSNLEIADLASESNSTSSEIAAAQLTQLEGESDLHGNFNIGFLDGSNAESSPRM
jgi:transposase